MPPGGTGRARRHGGGGPRQRGEKGAPSTKREEVGRPWRKQSIVKDEDLQQQLPAVDTPEIDPPAALSPPHQAASSSVPKNPSEEKHECGEEADAEADNVLPGRMMEEAFLPVQSQSPAPTDTETAHTCGLREAERSLSVRPQHTAAADSSEAAASASSTATAPATAPTTTAAAPADTAAPPCDHSTGDTFSGVCTPGARPSPTSFEHPPDASIEAPFAQSPSVPDADSRSSNKNSSNKANYNTNNSNNSNSSMSSSRAVTRPITTPRDQDTSKGLISPHVVSASEIVIPAAPYPPPSASLTVATRHLWLLVFSVLLTWVQDPLLSLLASAAAARMQQGASLAVVAVGAGGQVPDGMALLLVAVGSAVGALCSRLGGPSPATSKDKGGPPKTAAAATLVEQQQASNLTAALRVAAVGAWLAAGLGVVVATSLYSGSEAILSFFLTIKGSPPPTASSAAAAADGHAQEVALSLACRFLQLRCLSLPFCIVALTAKAALLTFRDFTPQLVTLAAAAAAAPLLFFFSAAAGAASPAAAAASFTHAAACTVSTVQVIATLLLLLRLGVLAAAATEQQRQQQPKQGGLGWLQQLRAVCWLYRPPLFIEIKAFAPFVVPVLTQCCVRMVLYSSMTKAASLWGSKAMAAHQLISGLYAVLGVPADTMAQVVNAAMPKGISSSTINGKRMQKRIFKVAACTAALSAAAQLVSVVVLTSRLWESDKELSKTAFYMGLCASVPLLFLPFASVMEGLLLRELRGATVARAYAATLPAPLLTIIAAEYNAMETHKRYLQEEMPLFVCCLWVLPLLYNVVKLAIMGFRAPRNHRQHTPLLSKDAIV